MKLAAIKIISFILVFLAGLVTGQIWLAQDEPAPIQVDTPIVSPPKPDQRYTELNEENARLRHKISELEQSKNINRVVSKRNTSEPKKIEDIPQRAEEDTIEAEVAKRVSLHLKAQEDADAFIEKYITPNDGQNISYEERLLTDFETEEKDLDWAPTQESILYTLFDENAGLQTLALEEADCRQQRCRLQILTEQSEDIDKTIEALQAALENEQSIGSSISVAANVDQGRTSFFVTRSVQ